MEAWRRYDFQPIWVEHVAGLQRIGVWSINKSSATIAIVTTPWLISVPEHDDDVDIDDE